jgi:hypothetical protein
MPGPFSGGTAPIIATDGADFQAELPNVSSYTESQHRAALVNVLGEPDEKVGFSLPRSDAWKNNAYRGAVLDLWYRNGNVATLIAALVALVKQGSKRFEKVYSDLALVENYGLYDRFTDDPIGNSNLRGVFTREYYNRPAFDLQGVAATLPGDLTIGTAVGPLPGIGAGAIGAVREGISAEGSVGDEISISSGDGGVMDYIDNEYAPYVIGGVIVLALIGIYYWWVR